MIIALFPNKTKKKSFSLAKDIKDYLDKQGIITVVEDQQAEALGALPLSSVDPQKIDFLISMGGDGTILRLLHNYPHLLAPVIGINLGGLGFMADIPIQDIYTCLEDLLEGAYKVEKRIMMQGTTDKGEKSFAVNDIVIHRSKIRTLVDIAIYVDNTYLNTFSADGIILATPSGSTAYSLSAGGPILTPELEAFVLTPICPHTISNRPIVLMPQKEIEVRYLSKYAPLEIIFDGIDCFEMHTGNILKITKSDRHFSLISLFRNDYFSTLRTKLEWSGKVRHLL